MASCGDTSDDEGETGLLTHEDGTGGTRATIVSAFRSQDERCQVCVVRPALSVTQRDINYHYSPPDDPGILETIQSKVKDSCSSSGRCLVSAVTAKVPILSWLPAYDVRSSLFGDVVSGITVAIMHIPQGMAYALLAGLPPIAGIYMAFFPVLIYALLGTSRHCSMGSFAVVCLMTGKLVEELATLPDNEKDSRVDGNFTESLPTNQTTMLTYTGSLSTNHTTTLMYTENLPTTTLTYTTTLPTNHTPVLTYTPSQVAAVVTLMNGIIEILLGVLQLGSLCVFLSDMLVSGFTTGAAVHVFTSQIKYLFGIRVQRYSGPFKIIYTVKDIVRQLPSSNPAAMIISAVSITVLTLSNEIIKPWFSKISKIPIPFELLAVIVGTLVSYFTDLHHNYNIRVVGHIPTGIPEPRAPPFELMSAVAVGSFVISIVSYTVSFSMAKIFAKRRNYNVDATQELYALGVSNVFGSFFGCAPISASLSRSLIQETMGGVTQITSYVSCCLLLIIMLFIGPAFETLPNCVLSSIIVVALKGMFMQVDDLRKVWAVSRADALIWIMSFFCVVIIDIDYGLLIGIITSLLVLLGRSQHPRAARLGRVPNTDVYLDVNKYSEAAEVPRVSIFQFRGPLHFANTEYFHQQVMSVTGLVPSIILANKLLLQKGQQLESQLNTQPAKSVEFLVIEMSGVNYIDSSGGKLLSQLCKEYQEASVTVCLAALSESVLEMLESCGTLKVIPSEHIFHSVHDAVTTLIHDNPCGGDVVMMHTPQNPSSDDVSMMITPHNPSNDITATLTPHNPSDEAVTTVTHNNSPDDSIITYGHHTAVVTAHDMTCSKV